jgi:hypothetical protein
VLPPPGYAVVTKTPFPYAAADQPAESGRVRTVQFFAGSAATESALAEPARSQPITSNINKIAIVIK